MFKIRKWLYEIRKDKDFTMAKVAEEAGISESYYSLIENGHRGTQGVQITTAKSIAKALGFDWTKFYEDEELKEAKEI